MKIKNTGKKPVSTSQGKVMPGDVYVCKKAEADVLLKLDCIVEVRTKQDKK